jgi:formylglycine-generating enzyme required for sulfatase activity/predicted esterase
MHHQLEPLGQQRLHHEQHLIRSGPVGGFRGDVESLGVRPWEHLGRTPITDAQLPRVVLKFRIEKNGFEPQSLAAANPSSLLRNATSRVASPIAITLLPQKGAPDMVPIPGGAFPVPLSGFATNDLIHVDGFAIDRYEISNKAFKQFVASGGYAKPDLWTGLTFAIDGREITATDAVRRFRDSTDRPGPSVWEVGEYPAGQDDYPVGGVSWYEAAAYCRSVGKTLPTLFHWARAALAPDEMSSPLAPAIIPVSNFNGKGPAPVGGSRGVGPYGTYDMGGNVREWVWNESEGGRRWILGGAWNDPEWMLIQRNSLQPFDRSPTNGFRCARYGVADLPARLTGNVQVVIRDPRSAKAVSNEVYEVFKRQFSYAKSALNDRIESIDDTHEDWTKLRLSFDAGYDNVRVPLLLFLPRNAKPPYQLVMYFPGLTAFLGRVSSQNLQPIDYIVKSGRAVVQPIYKGSYERWDTFLDLQGDDGMRMMRARMFEWRAEVGRTLDLMTMRTDIDMQRVAYAGASFGASVPLPLLALEDRFKTAVLLAPGLTYRTVPPEADAINYVPHVTMPVLMIGGRQDYVLPLEESQKPLYERLGTRAEHKRHVIFDAGHVADYPRGQTLREVLGWLDRYLGPVNATATVQ